MKCHAEYIHRHILRTENRKFIKHLYMYYKPTREDMNQILHNEQLICDLIDQFDSEFLSNYIIDFCGYGYVK